MRSRSDTAILFIYHSSFAACQKRIAFLRLINPGVPIYALFGGERRNLKRAQKMIELVDDHWHYPGAEDSHWKWLHVDIMLADWFMTRGQSLPWTKLIIYPWDTICLRPLTDFADELTKKNQALIYPHVKQLSDLKAQNWWWTNQPEYQEFIECLQQYSGKVPNKKSLIGRAMFLVAFTKFAFAKIAPILRDFPGMCEYRFATLLKMKKVNIISTQLLPEYEPATYDQDYANFVKEEVRLKLIHEAFKKDEQITLFHPVYRLNVNRFLKWFEVSSTGVVSIRSSLK
jgi:hypothetical protein